MKRIKDVVQAMPEKVAGEGVATDGQVVWLRSTGYFSEALLADLSLSQAAYLMEKAAEIQASGEDPKGGRRGGGVPMVAAGGGGLKILVLFAVLAGGGYLAFQRWGGEVPNLASLPGVGKEVAAEPTRPIVAGESEARKGGNAEEAGRPVAPQDSRVRDFGRLVFPAVLSVEEEVSMLDASGKETVLAVGSEVKVSARGGKGTLTVECDGKVYVGNEARLAGKVRER